ncbi:threonyl-tRNA synthetase editing domain-containing protein [Sulfuracidifex tepidarius]|uniref:Threonine--tRNA ligase 2 n=2 Tax=Sulfuracidifex tepidarius TaxID=1294262 RepID=A0A510E354_9CREN|nr:threonyl-tRNA synthetase editing domain-containing protein [Sulfuracidifex tepidarius]BBG24172.1 putative threonine--tRNA ligase 2 [Sulfuracidifex tepidarius]BBG26929.1 putative threonine--tRNA ligase 2 [Sulfuracidifex tepidarius]
MIILMIHSSFFSFSTREKAIESAEENPLHDFKGENVLVVFTAVEEGDDEKVVGKAVTQIVEDARKVHPDLIVLYPYAHLSDRLAKPGVAVSMLKEMENMITKEMKVIRAPFGWYKSFTVSCYGHPLSELSRRIRSEDLEEIRKSEEVKYCEKFGFPTSPHATFMRRAVISWLKNNAREMTVETEGNGSPVQGEFSVTYSQQRGKLIPCLNESPTITVNYGGEFNVEIPQSFKDSSNTLPLVSRGGGVTRVNVNYLTYYFLTQSFKGKVYPTLPMWMSPIQVRILPVGREFLEDAIKIAEELESRDIRVDIDDLNDGLGNKIRRAGKEWIPLVGVLGEREAKTLSLTVKIREETEQKSLTVEEIASMVLTSDPVKLKRNMPILLSRRPKLDYL